MRLNSAKCNTDKVVATIRKRATEEVETVLSIYINALYNLMLL